MLVSDNHRCVGVEQLRVGSEVERDGSVVSLELQMEGVVMPQRGEVRNVVWIRRNVPGNEFTRSNSEGWRYYRLYSFKSSETMGIREALCGHQTVLVIMNNEEGGYNRAQHVYYEPCEENGIKSRRTRHTR